MAIVKSLPEIEIGSYTPFRDPHARPRRVHVATTHDYDHTQLRSLNIQLRRFFWVAWDLIIICLCVYNILD